MFMHLALSTKISKCIHIPASSWFWSVHRRIANLRSIRKSENCKTRLEGYVTLHQSLWAIITRPIMHQPTNSTIRDVLAINEHFFISAFGQICTTHANKLLFLSLRSKFWHHHLWNDLYCVEWDVTHYSQIHPEKQAATCKRACSSFSVCVQSDSSKMVLSSFSLSLSAVSSQTERWRSSSSCRVASNSSTVLSWASCNM